MLNCGGATHPCPALRLLKEGRELSRHSTVLVVGQRIEDRKSKKKREKNGALKDDFSQFQLEMSIPRCVNAAAYRAARTTCRDAIRQQGLCQVQHFLRDDAVRELVRKSENLLAKGFRSFEEHNIYLENATEKNSRSFPSSKVLVNQRDLAKSCPELIELFEWPGLRELLEIAFDQKLFCSKDPLGGVYLNFFEKGDKLAWHFDRSEPLAKPLSLILYILLYIILYILYIIYYIIYYSLGIP